MAESSKGAISTKEREAYQHFRGLERHKDTQDSANPVAELSEEIATLLKASGMETLSDSEEGQNVLENELASLLEEAKERAGEERIGVLKEDAEGRLNDFLSTLRKYRNAESAVKEKIHTFIRELYAGGTNKREQAGIWRQVANLEALPAKIEEAIAQESRKSPEAFKAFWLLELRNLKRQFEKDGIMETPWLRSYTEKLMADVRRKMEGTNGVVVLLGPTGSGKTVAAKKMAKELSSDGKFEFVSAHSKMTPEDLLFRMGIAVDSIEVSDVPRLVIQAQEQYQKENPDVTPEELKHGKQMIKNILEKRAATPFMITKRVFESVARAAKEGRIVVIDEFNYLPPETLAVLNNLLSVKAGSQGNITIGDKVEEFVVKEGFGVIFTGNVGEAYLKRQKLDPALVNRILTGIVEYSYPPQEIDKSFHNSTLTNDEIKEGKTSEPNRNLFQINLTHLVDTKGNLVAPEHALDEIWNFSRVIALIEKLSAGKDFRSLGLDSPVTQGVSSFKFEMIFPSFRNLNQVTREWKLDGFTKPLNWYVFQNIIRPASVIAPKEAAQLFYLFKDWGGMFDGESWNEVDVDPTTWRIGGLDRVSEPKEGAPKLRHYSTDDVVEAFSGMEVPSYEDLKLVSSDEGTRISAKEQLRQQEMEKNTSEMEAEIAILERELKEDPLHRIIELLETICGESAQAKVTAPEGSAS